ncbi:MAG: ATP-binding cassette domain-containing protein [Gammaproteobacteria bacterium]|nr:ATP-binding cassette domain-containing protein [Gammaproteobacteria bacterium]
MQTDEKKYLLQWLKEQGNPQRNNLRLLSLLSVIAFVIQLIIFWQIAKITDTVIIHSSLLGLSYDLTRNLMLLLVLFCVFLGVERLKMHLSDYTASKLFQQQQSIFFDTLSTGQYALVRQHSPYFWQQVCLHHLPTVVRFNTQYLVQQNFVMTVPLIVLVSVFSVNWLIGFSLLLTLPVVPLFMMIIGKGATKLHQQHFNALSRLGSIFVDRLKALTLLRIFDAHDKQSQILSNASDNLNQRTMKVVSVAFLSATILDFFSTLAVALVAIFVGFNLLGEFSVGGQLTLHSGLFLLLTAPLCFAELKQLGRLYHLRAEAIAVAEIVLPILKGHNNLKKTMITNTKNFSIIHWQEFGVEEPTITAQRLDFEKGDKILLKGQSGSGKTCFLEALMGQRTATHGLDKAVLISQHAVILPITIRENVLLGRKTVTDERLLNILHKVELDDWLAQQLHGLDTVLDEHIPMSGGQQQRLALARVLLSDAEVILLDEPTAHLTDEQHQRLSQMIQVAFSNKTIIWASHKYLDEQWFTRQWHIEDGVVSV